MSTAETLLQVLLMALGAVALVIMLKDSQTNEFGSFYYSENGPFRYLVHASCICSGYSLLSAVVAAVPKSDQVYFVTFKLLAYMILVVGAISSEVAYFAYKGDAAIRCSQTWHILISSYRLFSKYDAPAAYNNREINIANFKSRFRHHLRPISTIHTPRLIVPLSPPKIHS
ncbi:CASP-like protein 2A1 [Olea europaea var. sylvestris]|uniref:CASP-like protein 2A1 n=1 Tax=Olea europaea var. sylvestris TaxID=158386 RepID=UPI000C1CCD58|nr:CASP-like protein 2A1 [Olea europaea var. sylvestris]